MLPTSSCCVQAHCADRSITVPPCFRQRKPMPIARRRRKRRLIAHDSLVANLADGLRRLRQTYYAHKVLCCTARDDLDDFSAFSGTYAHGSSSMLPVPEPWRRQRRVSRLIRNNTFAHDAPHIRQVSCQGIPR